MNFCERVKTIKLASHVLPFFEKKHFIFQQWLGGDGIRTGRKGWQIFIYPWRRRRINNELLLIQISYDKSIAYWRYSYRTPCQKRYAHDLVGFDCDSWLNRQKEHDALIVFYYSELLWFENEVYINFSNVEKDNNRLALLELYWDS